MKTKQDYLDNFKKLLEVNTHITKKQREDAYNCYSLGFLACEAMYEDMVKNIKKD